MVDGHNDATQVSINLLSWMHNPKKSFTQKLCQKNVKIFIPETSNEDEHSVRTVQEGNYEGSSQGMEAEAFKRCLDWLENKGILQSMTDFVSDQSKTIELELKTNERTQHVHIWNDPGHMALNFKRHLDTALGQAKAVKGISSRMESWFLTSVKLAEQESDDRRPAEILVSFTRRMSHFMWHYTGIMSCQDAHMSSKKSLIVTCNKINRRRRYLYHNHSRNRLRSGHWRKRSGTRNEERNCRRSLHNAHLSHQHVGFANAIQRFVRRY